MHVEMTFFSMINQLLLDQIRRRPLAYRALHYFLSILWIFNDHHCEFSERAHKFQIFLRWVVRSSRPSTHKISWKKSLCEFNSIISCWKMDALLKKMGTIGFIRGNVNRISSKVKFRWHSTLLVYKQEFRDLMEFQCYEVIGALKSVRFYVETVKFSDTWCEQDMMTNRSTWNNVLSNKTCYVKLPDFPVFILNFILKQSSESVRPTVK